MKTFNKKTLCAALASLGVLGMAGAAQAVNLNPDGLGQVLIYPYYTVRANADGNAFDSMFSVVNSAGVAKAVKVRFLEGQASHEVLDFNLYLSKDDVWTAVVSATATGAQVMSHDNSCTYGSFAVDGPRPLSNALFSGGYADGSDATTDRTREGYVEIIEMADVVVGSNLEKAITHVKGMPPNCAYIADAGDRSTVLPKWVTDDKGDATNVQSLKVGTGGLFGSMMIINVNSARAVGYDAVALDGFFTDATAGDAIFAGVNATVAAVRAPGTLWFPSGNMNPNLSMAIPTAALVSKGVAYAYAPTSTGWVYTHNKLADGSDGTYILRAVNLPGLDTVSAVMMRNGIYNEYMNADSVLGATDWVVTMPTKGLYYDRDVNKLVPRDGGLFVPAGDFGVNGAPVKITIAHFDREETTPQQAPGQGWSPSIPSLPPGSYLSWEANVIEFQRAAENRTVFNAKNANVFTTQYDAGWAQLVPDSAFTLAGDVTPTATLKGLPVIGFASTIFNNSAVASPSMGTVWSSYVTTVPHRYTRSF